MAMQGEVRTRTRGLGIQGHCCLGAKGVECARCVCVLVWCGMRRVDWARCFNLAWMGRWIDKYLDRRNYSGEIQWMDGKVRASDRCLGSFDVLSPRPTPRLFAHVFTFSRAVYSTIHAFLAACSPDRLMQAAQFIYSE